MNGLAYTGAAATGFRIAYSAFGVAWVVFVFLALRGDAWLTLKGLAWAQLVGIGSFGTFAVAMVMRALEGQSRTSRVVFGSALIVFCAAWIALCWAFWFERSELMTVANAVLGIAGVAILVPLAHDALRKAEPRTQHGWGALLALLIVLTSGVGIVASLSLGGRLPVELLQWLPVVHVHLALALWLVTMLLAGRLNGFAVIAHNGEGPGPLARRCALLWLAIAIVAGAASLAGAHMETAYGSALLLGVMGSVTFAAGTHMLQRDGEARERLLGVALIAYQAAVVLIIWGIIALDERVLVVAGPFAFLSWIAVGLRAASEPASILHFSAPGPSGG